MQLSFRNAAWKILPENHVAQEVLKRELGVGDIIARILVQRGFDTPETADRYLNPKLDHLHDPKLLPDYDVAIKEILAARENGDGIFIHGDYDVDGVSSAAILQRFLTAINCKVYAHVPHRNREGYGIHVSALEKAKEMGAKLLLTCDCGITAHKQIDAANAMGFRVVVTDHHSPKETLPNALAIVNPHRKDSQYPFKDLCGAGIVFRLCEGIFRDLGHDIAVYRRRFLDLAVLGTICDMMPLVDENRVIVKYGLDAISSTDKIGLKELVRISRPHSDGQKPLSASMIGFKVGPRINAVGRIGEPDQALRLLVSKDPAEVGDLAKLLDTTNDERRGETLTATTEAIEAIYASGYDKDHVLLIASDTWPAGIVGLVAGKLKDSFDRPAFALTKDADGNYKGSARSIEGFTLADIITDAEFLNVTGGGHALAAGCNVPAHQVEAFRAYLNKRALEIFGPTLPQKSILLSSSLSSEDLTLEMAEELERLEPIGRSNEAPLFLHSRLRFESLRIYGKNSNVADFICLDEQGQRRQFKTFAQADFSRFATIPQGTLLDVASTLEVNEYNGRREFQLKIEDVRFAELSSS